MLRVSCTSPDEAVTRHSLSCAPDSGQNPVSQALLGWEGEVLKEYELAFARRHARVAAARLISNGSVVLELGCVVPALKLLLPQGCRYIGSDLNADLMDVSLQTIMLVNYHQLIMQP